MRITAIHLPGFGRLSDFSCRLAPGLNLFLGDNETGKSTLQQAISALLYGFYDGDRARAEETARRERFRPWNAGLYRGSLEYVLDNGRRFEVRRDFADPDIPTQLIDMDLGTDVVGQFGRARHGNVPFARRHLGMSRGVFQSCAFISQGEIFDAGKSASPSEIGDAIAALADSARRDVSAARAIERLDAALSRIGSDRARTAELPVARDRLARSRAELQETDAKRAALSEKSTRLEDLKRQCTRLGSDVEHARYLLLNAESSRLKKQLARIDDAEGAAAGAGRRLAALRPHHELSQEIRDAVLSSRGSLTRSSEALDRLERRHLAASDAVTADERLEYEGLRHAGELTDDQVRSLAFIAYQPAPAGGLAALLRRLRQGLARLVRAVLHLGRHAPPETPGPAPLSREEAVLLLEKHRRYLALRPRVESLCEAERQLEAERASHAALTAGLSSLLSTVGISVTSDTDAALEAFESAWREREEYKRSSAAAEEARSRLAGLLSGSSRRELEDHLGEAELSAATLLQQNPALADRTSPHPPERLARDLRALEEQLRKLELARIALAEEVRVALEGHRARAEIEEDISHWSGEVQRLEQARSALALARKTIEEAMTQVYRDFAPAVNSFLSEGIEVATHGRYHRAHVDPASLRVSLLVPETGQVVTDPPVSYGTRTMLYVLMRIGLAQHMSSIGESVPLILDDPFVDMDARRLPRILDFLLTLSDRMQILLFTKDDIALQWFSESGPSSTAAFHEIRSAAPAAL